MASTSLPFVNDVPFKCFSGSAIKLVALSAMVLDHIAFAFIPDSKLSYHVSRSIGRIAYPVFALLLAEGFAHTRNRLRYFLSVLICAVLSEIPWSMVFPAGHNVFFTLAASIAAMTAFDRLQECKPLAFISVCAFALLAEASGCDYGYGGVFIAVIFYILRFRTIYPWATTVHYRSHYPEQGLLQMMFVFPLLLEYGLPGALYASGIVLLYDGRRGFIKSNMTKYAVYLFYPMHLTLIALWL